MKDLKIKYKIILSFVILIGGFSIVNTIVYISREYKIKVEDYKITGESLIQNVEPYIAEHIYINDIVGQQRIINKIIESNKDVIYTFVLDPQSNIIVHSFNQKFPSDLLNLNIKPEQNIELLDFGNHTVYDFSYPIVDGKLGILRIGLSRERLANELQKSIIDSVILLLSFLFLGVLLALYIGKVITNPLYELVDSAESISKGDFNHTVKIKSKDEIGILYNSFNSMCHNLQNLTDKLEEKIILLNHKNNEFEALNEEYMVQNEDLLSAKLKAEESDQLKTAFLANLSHEIRTPMNGILGFAELLKDKELSVSKQQQYVSVIEQSGNRMLRLINDLVDISKIEAGQVEIAKEKTEVNKLLDKIYTFFEPQAKIKEIELSCEKAINAEEFIILTDSVKLDEILTNLINNALKFTDNGTISFGYKLKAGIIQFWVKDTGRGIRPDMKDVIFERFRQANNTHLSGDEGSGLGLAICKAYIELMGGEIWVESEQTKGSTFYFNIPYIKSSKLRVSQNQVKLIEEICRDLTVLIAEDNEVSYLFLNEIFKNDHIKIIRASNGKEALDCLKKVPDINLILMDLKMPVLNGIDATIEIRKSNQKIPIIAQTAYASSLDKQRALSAGCTDFISKPINKNELFEKINHIL